MIKTGALRTVEVIAFCVIGVYCKGNPTKVKAVPHKTMTYFGLEKLQLEQTLSAIGQSCFFGSHIDLVLPLLLQTIRL